jgi:hypothetical protein
MNPYLISSSKMMRALLRTIAAATCLLSAFLAASADAMAYDLTTLPTSEASAQEIVAQDPCASYGRGFTLVGANFCSKVWGSITGYGYKEFTDTDITMIGQRIPTPFKPGAGVPIAYYFLVRAHARHQLEVQYQLLLLQRKDGFVAGVDRALRSRPASPAWT